MRDDYYQHPWWLTVPGVALITLISTTIVAAWIALSILIAAWVTA